MTQPKHKTQEEWALIELAEQLLEPVGRNDPYPDPYVIEDVLIYMGSPYVGTNEADNNSLRKMYIEGYVTDEDREGDFTYRLVALVRWSDQDVSDTLLAFKATYRVTYIQGYYESLRYPEFEQAEWEANNPREDW